MVMKTAWIKFKSIAESKGYKEKVVGDFSFTKSRNPNSPYIKLLSVKNGTLEISENGKRYAILMA